MWSAALNVSELDLNLATVSSFFGQALHSVGLPIDYPSTSKRSPNPDLRVNSSNSVSKRCPMKSSRDIPTATFVRNVVCFPKGKKGLALNVAGRATKGGAFDWGLGGTLVAGRRTAAAGDATVRECSLR